MKFSSRLYNYRTIFLFSIHPSKIIHFLKSLPNNLKSGCIDSVQGTFVSVCKGNDKIKII